MHLYRTATEIERAGITFRENVPNLVKKGTLLTWTDKKGTRYYIEKKEVLKELLTQIEELNK